MLPITPLFSPQHFYLHSDAIFPIMFGCFLALCFHSRYMTSHCATSIRPHASTPVLHLTDILLHIHIKVLLLLLVIRNDPDDAILALLSEVYAFLRRTINPGFFLGSPLHSDFTEEDATSLLARGFLCRRFLSSIRGCVILHLPVKEEDEELVSSFMYLT